MRRPVTSFARFHVSVREVLAIARRKGEGSILVNPFTSIGHGGYVECIIVSRAAAIFINGARDVLWRNHGVTSWSQPGDFNERIGALFDASSHGASSDLQFQLDLPPFSSSSIRGGLEREGGGGRGRKSYSDCLGGILKSLTADLAYILHSPMKFHSPITRIIAYNEVVKVLSAFSRCLILL